MPPLADISSLCQSCAEFDWTIWLRDKSDNAYILHWQFAHVFGGASNGCDLCAMIVHKYKRISPAPEVQDADKTEHDDHAKESDNVGKGEEITGRAEDFDIKLLTAAVEILQSPSQFQGTYLD